MPLIFSPGIQQLVNVCTKSYTSPYSGKIAVRIFAGVDIVDIIVHPPSTNHNELFPNSLHPRLQGGFASYQLLIGLARLYDVHVVASRPIGKPPTTQRKKGLDLRIHLPRTIPLAHYSFRRTNRTDLFTSTNPIVLGPRLP